MLHTSRTPNNRNKHRTPWQTHTWITPKGKAREAAAAGAGGGRRQHAYRNAVHTPAPSVDISRIDGPVNCPLGFECPPFDSPTSMRSDFDEAGLDDVSAALGALHLPGDENANIGNAACYHRRRDEAKVAHDCPVVQEGSYDDDASSSSSMPEESVDDLEPLSDEVMAQLQRCVHGDLFEVYDELVSSSVPNCERTYEEDMAELEELENAHCEIEDSAAEELRDTFAYYLELERMFVEAKHEENNDYSRMMTRFTPLKPESKGPNNSPGQVLQHQPQGLNLNQPSTYIDTRRPSVSSTTSSHLLLPIGTQNIPHLSLSALPAQPERSISSTTFDNSTERAQVTSSRIPTEPPLSARPVPRWSDAPWPSQGFFQPSLQAAPITARYSHPVGGQSGPVLHTSQLGMQRVTESSASMMLQAPSFQGWFIRR